MAYHNLEKSFFYRLEMFARYMRLLCREIENRLMSRQISARCPDDHGDFF